MSKIFGDEHKEEIRNLRKLDISLLNCKANIEEVIYVIENKNSFSKANLSLKEALRSIISLSNTVEKLLESIDDFQNKYNDMSGWLKRRLHQKKDYVIDFNRIKKVRVGAEKLIKEYNNILKQLGKRYREEVLKNG
tara:strand:- start:457 stop:864 length:408 start_codon:yes stop_codon:yes gene_type:complete